MALKLKGAELLAERAAIVRAPIPNRTRSAAAANPQASPVRASLVPGNAPLIASPLTPPREVVTTLVEPREPAMSLLGRIGGAFKGAVTGFVTGGPAGALAGATLGTISSGGARRPSIGSPALRTGTQLVGRSGGDCPSGSYRVLPGGPCVDLRPGGAGGGSGVIVSPGESRWTRGTAMVGASGTVPESRSLSVRRCGRGSVLGIDGLCYDKRTIRKDQRMWVPPRKPLMTGGDLNAIARASRAANRLKVQQRRLEKLGLLRRPKSHRMTKADAARFLKK